MQQSFKEQSREHLLHANRNFQTARQNVRARVEEVLLFSVRPLPFLFSCGSPQGGSRNQANSTVDTLLREKTAIYTARQTAGDLEA